ncbi:hypothetical protein CHLRE_01g051800v5 [Chlamydomonas reinhardtii]|uniref:Aminotransferase class I/classII large domain-containing protein n=1 Tax=Chlamydomonas reinhardtii TaxID=3055 RepID=A8HNI5_CHLRE|nr:uncharacterized protein CHLRE_01g051800v5 [Chlamydomonas reinhardtii]PNW88952.1 hypothetical protein CHLRE_01g051800v5 [Chlamydomonas reinhardtii]|eukprot:XP_001690253.1 aspartate aminotransferase [Chlamydomonas reinhardtii]
MSVLVSQAVAQKWKALSRRIDATDTPVIDFTRKLMASRKDAMSLAQGIVHWGPPPVALQQLATRLATEPAAVSGYVPNEGLPALRAALRTKLVERNKLHHYDVIVTPGCNQAFLNALIALCDDNDRVALFRPYYFDHLMAIQMTGGSERLVIGECDPDTMRPSLAWLERELAGPSPPKMVVLVNPCNPTGVLLSRAELDAFSAACAAAGCWLVLDNTYEDFVFAEGGEHYCPSGPQVVHLFSMSKAYGMMGWRIGYVAFPDYAHTNPDVPGEAPPSSSSSSSSNGSGQQPLTAPGALAMAQLKVQDAVCICAPAPSQALALEALGAEGRQYVDALIAPLKANRDLLRAALAPLEPHVAGGEGAIYLWARLPLGRGCEDDRAVVTWLVQQAGVCVIPGSACGMPGYIRCSYANLPPAQFPAAVSRLRAGLEHLVAHGMTAMPQQH